ncbi:hypothetical protein [Natranaerovirga pectinivora]|nr:hypothetical protein [Natranaerovirga pectinivora]
MIELKKSIKDVYKSFNYYTDPKEYKSFFDQFPNKDSDIVLKLQEILNNFMIDKRPQNRKNTLNVSEIICAIENKKREIVLKDQEIALLLLAIFKHKKLPCRLRCNFVNYQRNGYNFFQGKWYCELYNQSVTNWYLIDPTNKYIPITKDIIKKSAEIYLTLMSDKAFDNKIYYKQWRGKLAVKQALLDDLNGIMCNELLQEDWIYKSNIKKPEIYIKDVNNLTVFEESLLYKLAIMMINPDGYFDLIREIYEYHILERKE